MNVLYDISTLGFVHEKSAPKTGIPRVIEELAPLLAGSEDCDLELCSSYFLPSSLDYARSNPRLKNIFFAYSKTTERLERSKRDTQKAIDTASGSLPFTARAKRKLLYHLDNAVKGSLETLDAESLRWADIHHSTFSAAPNSRKNVKRPESFLTIYDLIPVLFPQYCNDGTDVAFRNILASITPETWLLSISDATKVDFCSHLKIDPARVFVTPLAADPDLFYSVMAAEELARVRQKYAIKNAPYVLSLCTIEPRKNIDHLIRCYVRLMQEGQTPDLQLVLAGSKGWDYAHIFQEIAGAEAFKDNIVVTGFVANEDLAALYSGALAFVYPSLYEGFGLPPLEAMQCGVPVITSNTSSLPEVVGDAGIMLDPHDADGLCAALLSLYQDADLRAQMSEKSLARAKLFSWHRCAEDTVRAYKTALGR